MGIANRDYYREPPSRGSFRGSSDWGIGGFTPVVKYLIFTNVVVFLLQIFLVREVRRNPLEMVRQFDPKLDQLMTEAENGNKEAADEIRKKYGDLDRQVLDLPGWSGQRESVIQEWFQLDAKKVVYSGQVWRLVTGAFCHDRSSPWHILFNMLFLFWFGCTLESMYGSREFFLFYMMGILTAAVAYIGLDLFQGRSIPAIGASGAVMAVTMLFTMHFPRHVIYVFWVIPLEMRWVMALYILFDLHPVLLALAGDRLATGVAHAAHLGGVLFGYLYYHYQWRLEPLLASASLPRWSWRRRPRLRIAPQSYPEPEPEASSAQDVDRILEKISRSGMASLTEREQAILKKASDDLRRRR